MIKKLLLILTLAIVAVGAQAQVLQLPGEPNNLPELYASATRFDISKHIPDFELRELPQPDEFDMEMALDLLDYAHTFLGTRYRRGGKTPTGFDCSGFTGYVFKQFGYTLNASSGAQFSNGEKVDDSDIHPGDLLFFKGRNAGASRIGHVGIAISADPETGVITFIHASCSQGISIDRTSDPYYARRYVGARRVLGL